MFLVMAAIVPWSGYVFAAPPQEGRAALGKWLSHAARVQTIQAEFEQVRTLATVRTPLRRPGKLWLERGGLFRWQIGEPPSMIVLRDSSGGLQVLDTKAKKLQLWTKEALLADEQAGRGQGIAMLTDLPALTSLADFDQRAEIKEAFQDGGKPSIWRFDLTLKDRKASQFVRLIQMSVDVEKGVLHSLVMQMRDGSSLGTHIRSYRLNASLDTAVFREATSGYEVKSRD